MTSAGLDWKNNPIPKLHGYHGLESIPELTNWIAWEDGCRRACDAVGVDFIYPMLKAMAKMELIPLFIERGVIPDPDGNVHYHQIEFQKAVVEFARDCGKIFKLPVPGDDMQIQINLKELKQQLASFGNQVKTAAERHRLHVFIGGTEAIEEHPLRALIEYRKLELTFYPYKNTKANMAWEDMNRVVGLELHLDPAMIHARMTEITVIRNRLAAKKPASEVDEMFIGSFIRKLQTMDGDETDHNVRLWRTDTSAWYKAYEEDPRKVSWDELQSNVLKALTRFGYSGVAPAEPVSGSGCCECETDGHYPPTVYSSHWALAILPYSR